MSIRLNMYFSVCNLMLFHLALLATIQGGESMCDRRGLVIQTASGTIQSPRHSDPFSPDHLCIWRVWPIGAKAVYFTFKYFNLQGHANVDGTCTGDTLTVYDSVQQTARTYCGDTDVKLNDPIYIPSSGMDIIFRRDFINTRSNRHGFTIEFRAVACPALNIPRGANVELDNNHVTLSCPGGRQVSFTCTDSTWHPEPKKNVCRLLQASDSRRSTSGTSTSKFVVPDLKVYQLSMLAVATLFAMGTVIGCAIYLGRRWSRQSEDNSSNGTGYNSVKKGSMSSLRRISSTPSYKVTEVTELDILDHGWNIDPPLVSEIINEDMHEEPFVATTPSTKQRQRNIQNNIYTNRESNRKKVVRDPRKTEETIPKREGTPKRASIPKRESIPNRRRASDENTPRTVPQIPVVPASYNRTGSRRAVRDHGGGTVDGGPDPFWDHV